MCPRRSLKEAQSDEMGVNKWSGRRDLTPRPLRPERSALPPCATARQPVLEPTTLQQIALNSPIWQIGLTDFGGPVVLIFVAFCNQIFLDNRIRFACRLINNLVPHVLTGEKLD